MPVTSLRKTCVRPSEVAKIKIKINSNSNSNSRKLTIYGQELIHGVRAEFRVCPRCRRLTSTAQTLRINRLSPHTPCESTRSIQSTK
ncbi:hypothetical protein DT037_04650 [Pseudomonas fulva]|nr:hypothetical protein [Pseudomonas fulva]